MEQIWQGLIKALEMLVQGDREVLGITLLTLKVSGMGTLISVLIGIPLGVFLALAVFPGRNAVVSLVNFGMGLPPVVVGLWVAIFLWRSGPLGFLNMIYTPAAIVVAQAIIAAPIVTGFTIAAIGQLNPKIRLQIIALGASRVQLLWLLVREARMGLLAAVIAGFGGVISEVGASMMVGGNIYGSTRVLTTATAMEVSKGNFDIAIALSVILMVLAYIVTFSLTMLQQRGRGL
ncbi:MAG: tungstate transporter permease [Peptococcaceae bacterium BICA1-7]|nr:MAG: tungstate transporter permease [Peptococcaceae bacterium BICA1-7]HBV95504.1 tungstate transporter permease [Desulfotomaculum sp.]